MKLPQKVHDSILAEAIKNARFSWYSGWEKSSGYIKSELSGENRFGSVRIYIKWEKKKEPTDAQIKSEIEKYISELLSNERHHSNQRDFTHYMLNNYYVDVRRLEKEVMISVENCLTKLIAVVERSDDFTEPSIQNLHNDLKNLQCGIDDHAAVSEFLEIGRKRVGES